MLRSLLTILVVLTFHASMVLAAPLKIGLVSTLSGANAGPGMDIRDGFLLAVRQQGGQLGGQPARVIVMDDQQREDVAAKAVDRLVREENVDFLTGIVFSDILLAVGPGVFASKTFYVSANAGPSQYAGERCSPYFFSVAAQNDTLHEVVGKFMQDKGFASAMVLVPNQAEGRDAVAGFRRHYRGRLVEEIYTRPGQLDFSAEIAQIRALRPQALYFVLAGRMAASFISQFTAAGLARDTQLLAPGYAADEDTIKAVGSPMLGMFNASHWAHDLDNGANRRFVADFQQTYGRMPSLFAAQGYDAAQLIGAAVRQLHGETGDKAALQKALEAARFTSVRGEFRLGANHFPVQNYYLRVVGKDAQGRVTNQTLGPIFTRYADTYVSRCAMR